jgi:CubicO group peptidase (beta-lactamase class C family)
MTRSLILSLVPFFILGQESDSLRLQKYIDSFATFDRFNGAILVAREGKAIYQNSFGFADMQSRQPNTGNTKFRIGSCSKQFTAIAILQLEELGKLSVKDKLSKYYPEFPGSANITIDMLLTHRSGLHDFYQDRKYAKLNTPALTRDRIIEMIKSAGLDFQPGTRYGYSNPGYFILGMIVEKVSNQTFDDYIRINILERAKMSSSGIDHNEIGVPNKAVGYVYDDDTWKPAPFDNMNGLMGCGNLYSTVTDMHRYFLALNDTLLLSAATRSRLLTAKADNVMLGNLPSNGRYAYGFMVDTLNDRLLVRHGGWCYGFKSDISMYQYEKVLVVVFSNDESDVWALSRGLQGVLLNVAMDYPHKYKEISVDASSLRKFAGQYGRVKIYKWGHNLYLNNTAGDDGRVKLVPETATRFSFEGENDRQVEFAVNETGKVTDSWLIASGIRYKLK